MPTATPSSTFQDLTVDPPVRGFLHSPQAGNGDGLILTHGAGANAHSPLLAALADTFSNSGFLVLRCDLPFRQLHSGPPRPGENARDRAGLRNTTAALRKLIPGRVFLGGHSYGGRQASMLCSEEFGVAAGLLLLSYPLHPPRNPSQLRIQHLPRLRTPTLFVHGTRDPFGSILEMEHARSIVPALTALLPVEGTGHDLGYVRGRSPEGLAEKVLREFTDVIGRAS